MNTHPKHSNDLFDGAVIFTCKSVACIVAGIAGVCASILLYGFVKNILLPALMSI